MTDAKWEWELQKCISWESGSGLCWPVPAYEDVFVFPPLCPSCCHPLVFPWSSRGGSCLFQRCWRCSCGHQYPLLPLGLCAAPFTVGDGACLFLFSFFDHLSISIKIFLRSHQSQGMRSFKSNHSRFSELLSAQLCTPPLRWVQTWLESPRDLSWLSASW